MKCSRREQVYELYKTHCSLLQRYQYFNGLQSIVTLKREHANEPTEKNTAFFPSVTNTFNGFQSIVTLEKRTGMVNLCAMN